MNNAEWAQAQTTAKRRFEKRLANKQPVGHPIGPRPAQPVSYVPPTGPRQPVLQLPTKMPNRRHTELHPFLWLLENRPQHYNDNRAELARLLGVSVQSVYKWERQCAADRNFPLPILRAGQIAEIFKVPAALLRPDVPWSN